jgi:enoyl-CoA hydratase/carnithine racemase
MTVLTSDAGPVRTTITLNVLDREAQHRAALFDTDDFAEGVAAFRNERPARFGAVPGVRA